ncbi:MAG: oxidoreductase [Chloroflexi bacterium RBG_13_57_8]|nr:MAG: oxidoreductase [Chloroflexi bacterium RBG_13_57_8]
MKIFTIDLAKCVGCYNCQVACKDEHCGNDWTPYAKPQPDTGQFWMKVNYEERGTIPKVRVTYQPLMCMHCRNAPCMASCPVEGAIYRRDDGLVVIDPKKCSGCRNCVHSCPYKVIYYNEDLHLAQKCTGCAHLLDRGWKEPRCADSCPTEAIKLIDETELKKIAGAGVSHPEFNTSPRVYYLNVPGKFVTGTVYDPAIKKVIVGAKCTLTGKNQTFTGTTDGFGDFWFENLGVGTYQLSIEKDGRTKNIDKINTRKDVNLGDIPF